jgi:lysophospholipase L1-like esterase
MLPIYKLALAPALLMQGAYLRKTALRLPEAQGPRSGHVGHAAAAPLRLLFIGDSSAAGVGVDWQHEAMPQQAAAFVSVALQRQVHWTLVAKSGVNTREAGELLRAQDLGPADVVISALGVNDVTSQRSARQFVADYAALLDEVRESTGAGAAVVTGLPPLHRLPAAPQPLRWYLGQCASRLDRALHALCAEHNRMRFVSLQWADPRDMALDQYHPGKAQYRQWAELVAGEVMALVADPGCAGVQPRPRQSQ